MNVIFKIFIFAVLITAKSPQSWANSIFERQPLLFGTIVVNGVFPQDMTITPSGSESHSAGLTPLRGHSNGVFEITSLPASTIFGVMIADTNVDGPGGAVYDVIDFTFSPDTNGNPGPADGTVNAQADGAGNLVLRIGATLRIQSGTAYAPGAYRGTYQLMLNF